MRPGPDSPRAKPVTVFAAGCFNAFERFQRIPHLCGIHANARVFDAQRQLARFDDVCRDNYLSAGIGVFNRI